MGEQGLSSASDARLATACREEKRCLVTLDLDFGNPLLFRPSEHVGIAVLRLPPKPRHEDLLDTIRTFLGALERSSVAGKLWIVERGRIREHQEP